MPKPKLKVKRKQICRICGREWNVSVKAKVPRVGYICPDCRMKRKRVDSNDVIYGGNS